MSMRPRHPLQIAALALAVLALSCPGGACLAQVQLPGGQPTADRAAQWRSSPAIDLDFRGGSAAEFIEAVRKAADSKVNIVTMPHVEEVEIPPMKLRHVEVVAALNLLDGESVQTAPGRFVELDVRTISPSFDEGGLLIKVDAKVNEARNYQGPQRSNIWSVADLIANGMTADNITTAVSAALELLGPESAKAQVRFHKETSLLLARAAGEQIEIINNVIGELRQSSAQQRSQSMRPMQEQIQQLSQELDRARSSLDVAHAEGSERLQLAEMAKARAEAMERHAADLEAMSSKLRDELIQRESQIRAMQSEISELRAALQKKTGGG